MQKNMITPIGMVIWANLAEAKAYKDGDKKNYSIRMKIKKPKDAKNPTDDEKIVIQFISDYYKNLEDLATAAKWKKKKRDEDEWMEVAPLKDGDGENSQGEPYGDDLKGHWFIEVRKAESLGRISVLEYSGEDKLVSSNINPVAGDLVRVSFALATYKTDKHGITARLPAILLVGKGQASEDNLANLLGVEYEAGSARDASSGGKQEEDEEDEDGVPF